MDKRELEDKRQRTNGKRLCRLSVVFCRAEALGCLLALSTSRLSAVGCLLSFLLVNFMCLEVLNVPRSRPFRPFRQSLNPFNNPSTPLLEART